MLQGSALQDLHHPQPPLHKKGLQTTLQTSRQSLARGLIDSGQRPPSVKVLVWLSSLCPFGVRHDYIYFRKHSCVPAVARFCANFQILNRKNRTF